MNRPIMLLTLVLFYSFLGVIYGLYGESVSDFDGEGLTTDGDVYVYEDDESRSGLVEFFSNVKVTVKETPTWLNLVLLVPLSVFFVYLLIVAWINPGG